MSTRICPVCGSDYTGWVERCASCGVELVALADAPDPLRLPEDQQVVYELGEWPLGMQAAAAQAMAESGIPHGWDRTDLVVQLDNEVAVDALLEEIEAGNPGTVGADWLDDMGEAEAAEPTPEAEAGAPPAADDDEDDDDDDDDDDQVGDELEYELDEWPPVDRRLLSDRLDEARLAYRWDGDDVLVVAAKDEVAVEALLDAIEYPDALPSDEDADDEDEAPFELMSDLFVAADRLKHNPRDPAGIAGLASFVDDATVERPPFGIEPAVWVSAVVQANDLADRLAGSADSDGDGFVDGAVDDEGEPVAADDDVTDRASMLRDLLRPYI